MKGIAGPSSKPKPSSQGKVLLLYLECGHLLETGTIPCQTFIRAIGRFSFCWQFGACVCAFAKRPKSAWMLNAIYNPRKEARKCRK